MREEPGRPVLGDSGEEPLLPGRRVALVHEWLVGWGGSEAVLEDLARLFPDAPIYTALWAPDPRVRRAFGDREVRTTFLDAVPGADRIYPWLLPLMPRAFRGLDLSAFDVVVSSSHAFAKAVRVRRGAIHLCYCHTPPRHLWALADVYHRGVTGALRRPLLPLLRRADLRAARGVDRFVANSRHVAGRIRRTYGRDAEVVHPPVDVARFRPREVRPASGRGEFYLAGGRLVRYKAVDVAVEAANRARFDLRVFGDGPERGRLERLAGPTVEITGPLSGEALARMLSACRAYLFPGVEDFGILPVEAQAAGSPVVARNAGGARETVVDGKTGVLYDGDGATELLGAVERLAALSIDPAACRTNAERYSPRAFRRGVRRVLEAGAGEEGERSGRVPDYPRERAGERSPTVRRG